VISIDASGHFAFVRVDHGTRDMLDKLVADLNSTHYDVVHVDVPCGKGAPRFALCSRPTPRGTAGYDDAVSNYLDTYEHLDLLPVDSR